MNNLLIEPSKIDEYLARLFPLNRSLTGDGNRETLKILSEIVPLKVLEYPAGTKVYDWTIPDEWSVRAAWIKNHAGKKIIDWSESNLHIVGYSRSVHRHLPFDELEPNLHYLEKFPDAIPYRTSYYNEDWGFCVTKKQRDALSKTKGPLEIYIDAEFDSQGSMSLGELIIPGRKSTADEYIVSTYICHPSMANDNLSGMLATALMAKYLLEKKSPEYTWRFVFVPETIGAISYLAMNEDQMKSVIGGFVVSCCGGKGPLGYKETFLSTHIVDRAVKLAFRDTGIKPIWYCFRPDGSDERQYSSPGFRIPVGTVTKDKYYEYNEYHTSKDNLDYVNGEQILSASEIYRNAIDILDSNRVVRTTVPNGEVRLGAHGLYPSVGGSIGQSAAASTELHDNKICIDLITWVLFLADGTNTLVGIAERSGYSYAEVIKGVNLLESKGLLIS